MALKDVKIEYRSRKENASLDEILDMLIEYCEHCKEKKDSNSWTDELFYEYIKVEELKKLFEEYKNIERYKNKRYSYSSRVRREIAEKLIKNINSGKQSLQFIDLMQWPLRLPLLASDIHRDMEKFNNAKIDRDKNAIKSQLSNRINELVGGCSLDFKKYFIDEKGSNIFGKNIDKFLVDAKAYAEAFNFNCGTVLSVIQEDLIMLSETTKKSNEKIKFSKITSASASVRNDLDDLRRKIVRSKNKVKNIFQTVKNIKNKLLSKTGYSKFKNVLRGFEFQKKFIEYDHGIRKCIDQVGESIKLFDLFKKINVEINGISDNIELQKKLKLGYNELYKDYMSQCKEGIQVLRKLLVLPREWNGNLTAQLNNFDTLKKENQKLWKKYSSEIADLQLKCKKVENSLRIIM